MSRLDLVIFGATGFTGKHAVIQMVKFAKTFNLTWAVAGRSEKKLLDVMQEAAQKSGEDVSSIKLIVADVKDDDSLNAMCAQCKVLVNCCGPYRLYGEPVVKAAIKNKTHYVDVSGEPQFMETMQLVYSEQARDAGVYVISACGWDSVPADLGVIYLMKNFDGVVNSVESYVSTHVPAPYSAEMWASGGINYGTWESLVYALSHHNELVGLRKKLYPEPLPIFKPKIHRKILHKKDGKWCLPFLGSDEPVVYRTQRHRYDTEQQRPVQFKAYLKVGTLFQALLLAFAATIVYAMSKLKFTRKILLDYPKLVTFGAVTKEGPSEAVTKNTEFKFELFGKGWAKEEDVNVNSPDKELVVEVSGTNPGYGATVVALLMCAITILREKEKMPPSGGVITPGIAFKNTNIFENLNANDLKFQVADAK